MIEFIIPAVLLCAGILFLIYPRQIGVAFCRLGKAIWRASTFGLTDMRWFYPEEKAPKIFRMLGIAWILFSIPWIVIAISSISGPGMFAAMRESRGHLSERFGSSSTWSVSAQPVLTHDGDYMVQYRYGEHSGTLYAAWKGDHYSFSDEKKSPNQALEPTSTAVTPPADAGDRASGARGSP